MNTDIVFKNVLLMFLLIIPGIIMRKTKMFSNHVARDFANTILYISQPPLIICSFIRPFDMRILVNAAAVFVFSMLAHVLYIAVALLLYKKAPDDIRRVLQFGTIFSNASYMGLPLITAILGDEAAIYISIYLIWFNVFSWSVGAMIYTGDKTYISVKKIFFNPAVISIIVGLFVFLLPVDDKIPDILTTALVKIKDTVAPMSMMMVGLRLADVKWKGILRDAYMAVAIFARLLFLPACVWGIMKLAALAGLYENDLTTAVILFTAATPVGTITSMFAEKFNDNSVYASKFVSLSTALSLLTIPVVCLLLKI